MSHRVTTQTEIKDRALAIQALKKSGCSYTERDSTLTVTSGVLNRATINLRTGEVSGDTDYHSKDVLGALRQSYAEAKYEKECQLQGITINGREVLQNGDIRLLCSMA